ncbi:MAG: CRISPR-associated endonuclease Cas6 [Clostridium sp.]
MEICKLSFNDLNENARFGEMLRGYLGNKYKENDLLHNHDGNKVLYRYPVVQYKVIDKTPMIIGINEGVESVLKIGVNEDEFTIRDKKIESFQISIEKSNATLGTCGDYITYEFKTPWIALNQKNINEYNKLNNIGKEEFLKKILIGNIISLSKGVGYQVEEKLSCWLDVRERTVATKNVKHIGFTGKFKVNFNIPNYLGIGKMVSKGFGAVSKIS